MLTPNFVTYEAEYVNVKPWNGMNPGPGKMKISIVEGTKSVKAKLKKAIEQKINSLGVRITSFKECADEDHT